VREESSFPGLQPRCWLALGTCALRLGFKRFNSAKSNGSISIQWFQFSKRLSTALAVLGYEVSLISFLLALVEFPCLCERWVFLLSSWFFYIFVLRFTECSIALELSCHLRLEDWLGPVLVVH